MKLLSLSILLLLIYSCNQETTKVEKSTTQISTNKSNKNGKSQLLFFLNPHGYPCQMQDKILKSINNKIKSKVSVKRIMTTISNDRSYFYQYGIRALPSLVLIDAKGNIIKRFSPGIQNKDLLIDIISNCSQC